MPFTCFVCKKSIDVGLQEMVVDEDSKNASHKSCLQDPSPPPPPPPAPSLPPPSHIIYHDPCARCGEPTGVPQRSCSRCYLDLCPKCIAAGCCGSSPASIGEKTYCIHCRKPCRSMCPYCKQYVHGGYGLSGTCGIEHEAVCEGARKSREPDPPKPVLPAILKDKKPIFDTMEIRSIRKKKPRVKRGRKTSKKKGKKKERARR